MTAHRNTGRRKHAQGRYDPILGKNNAYRGSGQVVAGKRVTVAYAPELTDGKARCDVCRNAVRVTQSGYLWKHNDLFGHQCYNKRPSDVAS